MTKKKKTWLFFLFWSIFSIVNLVIMYNRSLSGKSLSTTLITETVKKANISILIPDDWVVHETVSTQDREGISSKMKIHGGKLAGSLPWILVFQFNPEEEGFQSFEELTDLDISRVNEEYQIQSLETVDYDDHITVLFTYSRDRYFFEEPGRIISCRDWIGDKDDSLFIVSICATDEQWEVIDPIYDQIISSISVD